MGSSEYCLLGCLVRARLRKWISGQPRQEDCAPWGGTWPASLAVQPSHSAGRGARGGSRERRVTVGVWMRELLKVASQSIKRQGPHVGAGLRAAWHASPGGGGEGATHPRPGCTHTHLLSFPPRTETWGPQGGGDEARPEMVPDRWRSCPTGWDGGLPGRGAGTWTLAAGVDQEEQRSAGDPGRAQARMSPAVLICEAGMTVALSSEAGQRALEVPPGLVGKPCPGLAGLPPNAAGGCLPEEGGQTQPRTRLIRSLANWHLILASRQHMTVCR